RPIQSAFRVNPVMKPLQRGQRRMRVQTVNESQSIRLHPRNSPQHDDDDRRMRRKQTNRERQPNASIKSYEGGVQQYRLFQLQVIAIALGDGDGLERVVLMRDSIDCEMICE